MLSTINAKQ